MTFAALMLAFFRNNQVSTAILLAVYVGLLHLPALLGLLPMPENPGSGGGVAAEWLCAWLGHSPFFSAVAAAVVVFVQAILVNNIDAVFRLANERTWVPGMVYILVASMLPQFQFLTPPLLAATFVPIALTRLFRVYKTQEATSMIFDSAFWLAFGALFYPPVFWLVTASFVGVGILRSFNFRERIVFLAGCFVPFFLGWLWFFLQSRGGEFWQKQLGGLFGIFRFDAALEAKSIVQTGLMLGLVALVVLNNGTYFHKKLIQIQKYINILYWFLVVAGLGVLLRPEPRLEYFLLLATPLGLFLGLSFLGMRNKGLAEILHLGLLVLVFFVQFFPF